MTLNVPCNIRPRLDDTEFSKQTSDDWLIDWLTDRLTDWGLMVLSAQIGYIVPLKSMLQLKS